MSDTHHESRIKLNGVKATQVSETLRTLADSIEDAPAKKRYSIRATIVEGDLILTKDVVMGMGYNELRQLSDVKGVKPDQR